MKPESQKFVQAVLELHNQWLYDNLIYERNLCSDNLKEVEFQGKAACRGYFARKHKNKYWIDEELARELPIRVGEQIEELVYKDDVIIHPLQPSKFKIVPSHSIGFRELVDGFIPFDHSEPSQWLIFRLAALASMVGRTYLCICSESSFGKSSAFDVLHFLTDKCPVYKPRSVPGVLVNINGTGNIVFDEVHDCQKDVKDIMEEFSLQIGGGKSVYINGAMKSGKTKSTYMTGLQSITYLYNVPGYYKKPEKDFFDYTFSNNKALDDRFLKLRLTGSLTERFNRDFDLVATAYHNRQYYLSFAKELAWLQSQKQEHQSLRRYVTPSNSLGLNGRKRIIFEEITWTIDQYACSQQEYEALVGVLVDAIQAYQNMKSSAFGGRTWEETVGD